ncbi:hypothetical protein CLV58_109156 [Spirosoma oryzae]|uniref:Uncharacterized protein n=2 Tax=Spirosoma oryzae TaxID=1469603 RepID=A0A2T0SYG5_9BACT|nr:hypothetical protein CLV58_109156 [Spirosoma oryzae]
MTDQGHGGLPAYLDSLGFSDVRILANPNVPEDKMIVPSEWLDPKSTAIDDKD